MRLETIEKLQSKGFPLNRIQILYPFPVRRSADGGEALSLGMLTSAES